MAKQGICVKLYSLLTQNSLILERTNSFIALAPSYSSPCCFLLFFLGSQVPLLAGEPTTPAQSWPRNEMGLRGGCGQGGKGSDDNWRGLLGTLLSWQEVGRRWLAAPSHCLTTCPPKSHRQSARNENSTMNLLKTNTWFQKDACYFIRCVLLYLNHKPLVLFEITYFSFIYAFIYIFYTQLVCHFGLSFVLLIQHGECHLCWGY